MYGSPNYHIGGQELGGKSLSFLSEDDQPEAFEPVYNSSESHLGSLHSTDENANHPSDEDQTKCSKSIPDSIGGFRCRRSALPSLLQVSRQISDEALDVLYGGNVFKIVLHGGGQDYLKTDFCEANMRHVMLVLRPVGVSYRPAFAMDEVTWNIILPHLRHLWIVAEQPLGDDNYWNGQTIKQKMKEWIEWLTPIRERLANTLSAESTVFVDVDQREETVKSIRKYPPGCREVQTETGDFVFRRGEFSIGSGY